MPSLPTWRAARLARHAGGTGIECAPGTIELARCAVAVLGQRYSAELGGPVRLDLAHRCAMRATA